MNAPSGASQEPGDDNGLARYLRGADLNGSDNSAPHCVQKRFPSLGFPQIRHTIGHILVDGRESCSWKSAINFFGSNDQHNCQELGVGGELSIENGPTYGEFGAAFGIRPDRRREEALRVCATIYPLLL